MRKAAKFISHLSALIFVLILPVLAFASNPALERLNRVGAMSGFEEVSEENGLPAIMGMLVSAFLSILGIIFIILFIYSGYMWMTAAGDEGKVTKAKDTMRRAVIGLLITVGSYALWYFIYAAAFWDGFAN